MTSNARVMAEAVDGLRQAGWRVVVAHGNGPQVGNLAIQQDAGEPMVPRQGWRVVEDAGRGYRRVVPSPAPLEIVEARAITRLLEQGYTVVAAGGGGIPVAPRDGRLAGVEAVIDKDLAAALPGTTVGARALVLVTDVDAVMLDFGTSRQRPLTTVSADEMRQHLHDGHFPEGSMGPKVRACLQFLDSGGGCAVIARPRLAPAVLSGHAAAGTRIVSRLADRGAA
jgi:carbamate kinase